MKKEVLIAISFGLIVGLIITVGMYRARTALEVTPPEDSLSVTDTSASPEPSSTPQTDTGLIIREPADEALSTTSTLQVTGATFANRAIVILVNEREIVGMSDEQGNFSFPVTLAAGGNILKIRVLNPGSAATEVTRTVVYELPLGAVATDSGAPATPTAKPKK